MSSRIQMVLGMNLFLTVIVGAGCSHGFPRLTPAHPDALAGVLNSKTSERGPTLVLSRVTGSLADVTAVQVRVLGITRLLTMSASDKDAWETSLSETELSQLIEDKKAGRSQAEALIHSVNHKNYEETIVQPVEFLLVREPAAESDLSVSDYPRHPIGRSL